MFLLLGYGTKVGLVPLHAWLPDAHAEGPTPISAVLSGLLLNVALYAVLRFKMLLAGNPEALAPGPLMIGMGLVSLLFAAFMLYRRRDIKRLFAYSSIEHMGIITFAFGMGGPLANFAGLLHMTMHSLTKSAIFFAVGHIAQVKGTQKIADIGGLTASNPLLGWGLVVGVVAIAGLPPLGIFMSEFLVVELDLGAQPLLALPLVLGLLVAIGALFLRLNRIAFGEPRGANHKVKCSYVPMFAASRRSCSPRASICPHRSSPGSRPWRSCSDRQGNGTAHRHRQDRPEGGKPPALAARHCRQRRLAARDPSAGRGARHAARPVGRQGRSALALLEEPSAAIAVFTLAMPRRQVPFGRRASSAGDPARARHRDLYGLKPVGAADTRPWLDLGFWGVTASARHKREARGSKPIRLRLPARGRRGPASDPGRPRPCRHHRARAFPLHRQRRDGGAARGAARLCAQGHRVADDRRRASTRARKLAGRTSGDSTVAYALAFAQAVEAALQIKVPARAVWLRALMAELERIANHFGDIGAICNDASFSLIYAECGILRERTLRAAQACFGHRLMMDRIVPGGVDRRSRATAASRHLRALIETVRQSFPELVEIYDNTASLQDRTVTTGYLAPTLARAFGAGGYVGRASGRAFDARESGRLCALRPARIRGAGARRRRRQCARMDPHPRGRAEPAADRADPRTPARGPHSRRPRQAGGVREGLALVEAFRGDVLVWVRIGADGTIERCHLRDPSWFQWPLLEVAIEGNIVADFPLCNKSFNCSYSGHDL